MFNSCFGSSKPVIQEIRQFPSKHSSVDYYGISPDNKMFALGSPLEVYELNTGKLLFSAQHQGSVTAFAFSPDSTMIISGDNLGTIKMWNIRTGRCLAIYRQVNNRIIQVGYSRNGEQIVSESQNGLFSRWDIQSGECLSSTLEDEAINQDLRAVDIDMMIGYRQDRNCLGMDNTKTVVCTKDSKRTYATFNGKFVSEGTAFSSDGETFVALERSGQPLKVWRIRGDRIECLATFPHYNTRNIITCVFSSDRRLLVSAYRDRSISVWDMSFLQRRMAHGNRVAPLPLPISPPPLPAQVAASIVPAVLPSLNYLQQEKKHDPHISISVAPTGKEKPPDKREKLISLLITISFDSSTAMQAISYTGNKLIISHIGAVITYPVQFLEGVNIGFSAVDSSSNPTRNFRAYSLDRKTCAVYDSRSYYYGNEIIIWDAQEAVRLLPLGGGYRGGYEGRLRNLYYSSDGETIISSYDDKIVKIWDAKSGECLGTIHSEQNDFIAISSDSTRLAYGSKDKLQIWDISAIQKSLPARRTPDFYKRYEEHRSKMITQAKQAKAAAAARAAAEEEAAARAAEEAVVAAAARAATEIAAAKAAAARAAAVKVVEEREYKINIALEHDWNGRQQDRSGWQPDDWTRYKEVVAEQKKRSFAAAKAASDAREAARKAIYSDYVARAAAVAPHGYAFAPYAEHLYTYCHVYGLWEHGRKNGVFIFANGGCRENFPRLELYESDREIDRCEIFAGLSPEEIQQITNEIFALAPHLDVHRKYFEKKKCRFPSKIEYFNELRQLEYEKAQALARKKRLDEEFDERRKKEALEELERAQKLKREEEIETERLRARCNKETWQGIWDEQNARDRVKKAERAVAREKTEKADYLRKYGGESGRSELLSLEYKGFGQYGRNRVD